MIRRCLSPGRSTVLWKIDIRNCDFSERDCIAAPAGSQSHAASSCAHLSPHVCAWQKEIPQSRFAMFILGVPGHIARE
jgi:hypothetical protein